MSDSRGAGGGCPTVLIFEVEFLADEVFGGGCISEKKEHCSKS
jgi:hypothetical protein